LEECTFEPKIIVFACNWCSYAGADLAGVSRLSYPPNIKIIRIMCTGRMNLSILLGAFLHGADGVMLCGCHFGNCHYVSGNEKADIIMKMAKELADIIGLGALRLEFRQISAAEGALFAKTMKDFVEKIKQIGPNPLGQLPSLNISSPKRDEVLHLTKAYHCYQCAQCTGGCPISRKRTIYNPRRGIRRLVVGMEDEVSEDLEIWTCRMCGLCKTRCPQRVDIVGLVKYTRIKAYEKGNNGKPSHDGLIQKLVRLQLVSPSQNRISWVSEDLRISKQKGEYIYFVGCLPYLDVLFRGNGAEPLKIAKDTLKILNHLGVEPVLMEEEKCCGHDALYSGDIKTFLLLARYNIEKIRESGAKKVIFSCPECYHVFKDEYPKWFKGINIEPIHIVEFLAKQLSSKRLKLKPLEGKVTFQDSCRLGRFSQLYEEPRLILREIMGLRFVEMDHTREEALCCGGSGWTNCFNCSKRLQSERLLEVKRTGADTLVSACPKCQIHFMCAQETEDGKIAIKDITNLVREAIK
jgi:Fe-S oxidoreductase/coenzyme F420-reducing hydrogenase delta subunit